jgi:hypothetical protein
MIPKGLSTAKAALQVKTDVEGRRHRTRTGLVTPVVFAVNDECHKSDKLYKIILFFSYLN